MNLRDRAFTALYLKAFRSSVTLSHGYCGKLPSYAVRVWTNGFAQIQCLPNDGSWHGIELVEALNTLKMSAAMNLIAEIDMARIEGTLR